MAEESVFAVLDPASSPPEKPADRLSVPLGSRMEFFLPLPPDARLVVDRLETPGGAPGRISVSVATDESGEREAEQRTSRGSPMEWALTADQSQLARLTLEAAESDPEGAVTLIRPRIVAPPARHSVGEQSEPALPSPRPDIIIYLVDALRADHLGCYGYPRAVSPNVNAFAEDAILFENAIGQSSWTRSSVASIFTGLWPLTHSVVGRKDGLSGDGLTLAEILGEAGYQTVAVVTNPNVANAFGMDQGFQVFEKLGHDEGANVVVDRAIHWLEDREDHRPLALYVHSSDPHNPYLPPEEYRQRFAPDSDDLVKEILAHRKKERWDPNEDTIRKLKDLYDGEIAFNDHEFGRLLAHLSAREKCKAVLLVYVSDHGDEFFEHGQWAHGHNLHLGTLNVPLIVRFPGDSPAQRIGQPVQHADLLPTLLEYLGLEVPDTIQGRSLMPLIASPESPAPRSPDPNLLTHQALRP